MRAALLAGLVGLAGCGAAGEGAVRVPLTDVPEPALKTAREKAPGFNLTDAYRKPDGTYEVRGKDRTGKVREVEVKGDGTFVALE